MSKIKTSYFCQSCGHSSPKWLGKCPSCSEWNTFVEEIVQKEKNQSGYRSASSSLQRAQKPQLLSEINFGNEQRIDVKDNELNRVLGGG